MRQLVTSLFVVEDDEILGELLVHRLEESGYIVRLWRTAQGACDACADGLVDLVLTDLRLPGGSGVDVVRSIRAHSNLKKLPIIVMTAGRFSNSADLAIEAGANAKLEKPFTIQALISLIELLTADCSRQRS